MLKKLNRMRFDFGRDRIRVMGLAQTRRGTSYIDRVVFLRTGNKRGPERRAALEEAILQLIDPK